MHRHISAVYGDHCRSLTSVHEWSRKFREGRTSLQDDACPGQTLQAITPDVIRWIDALIQENRRIMEEAIRVQVGISHGSMHAIIRDHLHYHKICAQWVPHQLTEEQKIDRMVACLSHLQRYHKEVFAFLSLLSQGMKLGAIISNHDSKRQSQQWKHQGSPLPKKSKAVHTSSSKVMMTLFFDCRGPLLVDFERETTINVQRYDDTLQKLRRPIKSKRPGMLSDGIILLHDNAHPHATNLTKAMLQRFGSKTLFHLDEEVQGCEYVSNLPLSTKLEFMVLSPDGINV